MNKTKCFCLCFAFLLAVSCWAQESVKEDNVEVVSVTEFKPICGSTIVNDSSKIIKNPGNCPIEILRRLGRVLGKYWPEGKSSLKSGTIMINEYVGAPNFIKTLAEDKLSEKQLKECDDLIKNHTEIFTKLSSEFESSPEAITIKTAFSIPEIEKNLKSLIASDSKVNTLVPLSETETNKINNTILPVINIFKDCCGIVSLSEKGIFGRATTKIDKDKIKEILPKYNLTIGDYIDYEPLIILAQTHGVEDPENVMKKLDSLPNMVVVKQLVASAGIDLQKDILENYAQESILYVNLTPTGEKMIPDIRWVVLVPNIEKLLAITPKFKNLCMATGIFITEEKDSKTGIDLVRLNHFMAQNYGVYTGVVDRFCVLASTKEGAIAAINHIKNPTKTENKTVSIKDCNLFFRLKTSDLNVQLQQFLQSPMLRNQGIPPITNLTFLNDMNNITVWSILKNDQLKFFLDIPFILKKNEK